MSEGRSAFGTLIGIPGYEDTLGGMDNSVPIIEESEAILEHCDWRRAEGMVGRWLETDIVKESSKDEGLRASSRHNTYIQV